VSDRVPRMATTALVLALCVTTSLIGLAGGAVRAETVRPRTALTPASLTWSLASFPDLPTPTGSMCLSVTLTADQSERLLQMIVDGLRPPPLS
jgi:hypothetical protein